MPDAPLKLEVGRTYKNRRGEKIYIESCIQPFGKIKEFNDSKNYSYPLFYQENGRAVHDAIMDEILISYDLIEETTHD